MKKRHYDVKELVRLGIILEIGRLRASRGGWYINKVKFNGL